MSTSNVTAATTAGTTSAPATPAAKPETTTAKVFVGNLSFKTKTAELAAAFSVAGHVVSANIITRGPRSLGYGFVELESDEDAQKAVSIMHKKEIDGREINVEVAKPRDDAAPNAPGSQGGNQQGGAPSPKPQQDSQDNGAPRSPGQRGGRGRGLPRRRRGFSGGYNQGGYQNQGGNFQNQGGNFQNQGGYNQPQGGNQGGNDYNGFRGSRGGYGGRGGFRGGRGGQGGRNAGNWQQGAPNQAPRQQNFNNNNNNNNNQQGGNQNQNQAPRDPSPTTLFVANIPFTVNDAQLAETFKDFNVVKAHVVLKRNGRSKGFGFVELKSTEDQQKALAAFEKKEMGGRELIVKVALAEPAQNQGDLHSATAQGTQETKQENTK